MFPNADSRLYGYQPQANLSFTSEVLPSGSAFVTKDDVGGKVTQGDFSSRCFADAAVCNNF